jgi:hypothetical protein
MYFWNINKLKSDFNEGAVTEKSILKYLIAYTILAGLVMIPYGETNQFDMFSAALMIPLSVFGLLYAYACNGGDSGNNFIAKYFAIGWVITIRFMPVIFSLAVIVGIIVDASGAEIPEGTTLWDVLIEATVTVFLFWRIAVHIKHTSVANIA